MKISARYNFLLFVGLIFGLLGEFHTTVGLPNWTELVGWLVFLSCFWMVVWLQRRAKKRGDANVVPATSVSRRRNTWLMLVFAAFLACVTTTFGLRNSGSTLPFSEIVIIEAIVFVVLAASILFLRCRQERDLTKR